MAILQINGADMPSPKTLSVSYKAIGKSEQNAAGAVVMDRIALKRALSVAWGYLSAEQALMLLGAANGDQFMTLTFIEPSSGTVNTGTFFVSNCSAEAERYENGLPARYKEISISFTER